MFFDCLACEGQVHAMSVNGSILSDSGNVAGICANCRQWQVTRDGVGPAILAVGNLLSDYRNQPVIKRGKQPRFDWAEGLVGESTPDEVIVPAAEPVSLATLLRALYE